MQHRVKLAKNSHHFLNRHPV